MTGAIENIAVVLDSENSDPAWGGLDDVMLRPYEDEFRGDDYSRDVSLAEFLGLVEDLIESMSADGCPEDLCVVESAHVSSLEAHLRTLGLRG